MTDGHGAFYPSWLLDTGKRESRWRPVLQSPLPVLQTGPESALGQTRHLGEGAGQKRQIF